MLEHWHARIGGIMKPLAKQEMIAALEAEITGVQQEINELRKSVDRIGHLQTEMAAMRTTLARFKGKDDPQGKLTEQQQIALREILESPAISPAHRGNSIPSMTYEILTQAGKPLRGDEIVAALAARGRRASKDVILGALYRDMKNNEVFRLVMPGVFGLKQWGEEARN